MNAAIAPTVTGTDADRPPQLGRRSQQPTPTTVSSVPAGTPVFAVSGSPKRLGLAAELVAPGATAPGNGVARSPARSPGACRRRSRQSGPRATSVLAGDEQATDEDDRNQGKQAQGSRPEKIAVAVYQNRS
jgi:hypothetical protein